MIERPDSSLEEVWTHREEVIYPALFGGLSRGTFVLSGDIFSGLFRQSTFDPRWLHYGIIEFAPDRGRDSWIYVTSGASNPWEVEPSEYAASEYSGFGTELVLETRNQAQWAIICLQRLLAFNILLAHGRFGTAKAMDYGDRIPFRCPITLEGDTLLTSFVIGAPSHFESFFMLASGRVELLQVVGVAESEITYAREHGSDDLIELLKLAGAFPVTNPTRQVVV